MASTSSRLALADADPGEIGIDLDALAPFLEAVGPVAVVDFETTGLPGEGSRAEPIELGCVLLDPGRVRLLDTRFRPYGRVPRSVTALTGLRDDDLVDAPRLDAVAPEILAALDGRCIIAHNAEFERHFLTRFVSGSLARATYLDTQDLLALTYPDVSDLRLETFTALLLQREERHRALSDALDTACVMSHIACGARDGESRQAITRASLDRFAPGEPWAALLEGPAFPALPAEPEAAREAQYIAIPKSGETRIPFDVDAIAAALADEERGRRWFPRYRVRQAQIDLAREFVRLLDEGGRLLLEGGTGVGKSLAYLAAAIPFAAERSAGGVRDPVIVSTRTKVLQDQLLGQDIPAAAAMLGYPELRALSIKGRANYLCRRRTQQVLAEGNTLGIDPRDRLSFAALSTCAQLRPHGEVGTLPGGLLWRFPPLRDLRRRSVASRAEHCTREQCAAERTCPFGRRRAALGSAQLVVANHDLLLRWPSDYPNFQHVVADEGHELTGVADEAYANEVRPEELFERLGELFGAAGRRGRPLLEPRTGPSPQAAMSELLLELRALGRSVATRASDFGELQLPANAASAMPEASALADRAAARLDDLSQTAEDLDAERDEDDAVSDHIERCVVDLRAGADALRAAFAANDSVVAAFDSLGDPHDRWRLALRQVSPASAFHGQLLDKLESFAAVSASLFVEGDPFAALGELDVESNDAASWRVQRASPFPYAEHMRVVALSDPGDPVETTVAVLADVARALGGRTLGLFTSLRRMRDVQERLSEVLREDGIEILMPRRATDDPGALVERFRRAEGGHVLLGSRTFWQGIDLPGDALQAVVIEKLPFEVPTELRRRREGRVREEGGDAFERYTLGKMLLNLKQMIGRLVRSEDDRGLVVVVDARPDKRYFRRLSGALPPGCEVRLAAREELPAVLAELGLGEPSSAGLRSRP